MAKILLVHPLFLSKSPAEQRAASPYFPLGVLSLAAYVREHGHDVAVFDGTFEPDESAFADRLEREHPDVVGIATVLSTRATTFEIARTAASTGVAVVVGGPDATTDPYTYLTEPAVDIVVHHEGEQTLRALLDLHDAEELTADRLQSEPGVAFRVGGRVIVTEPRPPIEDLDALPLPARDLIDMDRYLTTWRDTNGYSSMTISVSRGCPYGCDWCRDSVHGTGFRRRSPESVAAEVKALQEAYPIDRLRVVDDVDGLDRAWIESWAAAAEKAGAAVPFEALNDLARRDLPLLDVRDSL
ncbi:MAG: B12-binding domain-containing radical SAM protein [Ilumatobacteraceae bacterium]